jgi:transcriptional regulator with XRE-family HTH domain
MDLACQSTRHTKRFAPKSQILKEERKKRGISLNLLSEKAGLSRQAVAFVEQETRTPSLETLLRITSALNIDLEKIIAKARRRVKARF